MSGRFDITTAQFITAVTEIFIPLEALDIEELLSVILLCKIIGIN